MNNHPLVTVCIPTYNNAKYIGKTLKSILEQTYKNLEIIVMDNASTDNTEEIIKSFSDKRIRYYKNSYTIVCLANWNNAIKVANGKYVALYHSDDIYEQDIVEKEVKFLEIHPETGAVFCLDKIIDEKDRIIKKGTDLPRDIRKKDILKFNDLFISLLKKSGSFLVAPTFIARREIFNNVGFFLEDNKFGDSTGSAADTEMWLRISQKYPVGIIKERLIKRRISKTQGSAKYENSRVTRANHFIVLDSFFNSPALGNETIEKSLLQQYEFNKFWDDIIITMNLVNIGKQNDARKILLNSFSWDKLLIGFKSIKNLLKVFFYYLLIILTLLGISKSIANIFGFIRRKLWSN